MVETLGHNTECGTTGLGQYNSLGEYCGLQTASSVFLILILKNEYGICISYIRKVSMFSDQIKRYVKPCQEYLPTW